MMEAAAGIVHHGFGRICRVAWITKDEIEFPFLDVGHALHEPLHVTEIDLQIKPGRNVIPGRPFRSR